MATSTVHISAFRVEIEAAVALVASDIHTWQLDADVIEAMVMVESGGKANAYRHEPGFWTKYMAPLPEFRGFNPDRYSSSYGLMQPMWIVAVEVGFDRSRPPEHLFVPETSLQFGCLKMAQLMTWAGGNRDRALAAYNGGRGGNSIPPYRNQGYADKVNGQLAIIQRLKMKWGLVPGDVA